MVLSPFKGPTIYKKSERGSYWSGLGKSSWSEQMLKVFLEVNVPIILDADALNLISDGNLGSLLRNKRIILTPHSGEAARLLGCTTKEIDKDRFSTVRELQKIYGGTVLLKGEWFSYMFGSV